MAKKKQITIPDPVEACQAFASLDEIRTNLQHVIIGPKTWATDGHTLLVCETPNAASSSLKRVGKKGWTSGDPDVKMPGIDQVIPKDVGAKVAIDRDYLDAILKTEPAMLQIHGLKERRPRLVAIYQLDTGQLKGTFERPDDKAAYPLQLSGPPDVAYDAIGMDPKYIARAVWACYAPGERVELEVQVGEKGNLDPIRIRANGRTALVMPMRIEPSR